MIVAASTVLLFVMQVPAAQLPVFLPTPVSVERGEGVLVLQEGGVISFEVREAEQAIER